MPTYDYRAADGEMTGVFAPMHDAPPLGHEVTRDGKVFKRVFSLIASPESRKGSRAFPRFQSKSLPRRVVGDKAKLEELAAQGHPMAERRLKHIKQSEEAYSGFEKRGGTFNEHGQPQLTSNNDAVDLGRAVSGGDAEVRYGE